MTNFNDLKEVEYSTKNESSEHEFTKREVYKQLKSNCNIDKLYFNVEHTYLNNKIADIGGYFEGKLLAIEIIHKHDNYDAYIEKVKDYHRDGIHDFWIFTEDIISQYVKNNNEPSDIMMDLNRRFGGIYFFNKFSKQLVKLVVKFNGIYQYIKVPVRYKLRFNELCFAEQKYQEYVAKEEYYKLEYAIYEAEEMSRENYETLSELAKESLTSFEFNLDEPVKCKFVKFIKHPEFGSDSALFKIGDELKYPNVLHKNLKKQLSGLEDLTLEITLIKEHDPNIKFSEYKYKVVKTR